MFDDYSLSPPPRFHGSSTEDTIQHIPSLPPRSLKIQCLLNESLHLVRLQFDTNGNHLSRQQSEAPIIPVIRRVRGVLDEGLPPQSVPQLQGSDIVRQTTEELTEGGPCADRYGRVHLRECQLPGQGLLRTRRVRVRWEFRETFVLWAIELGADGHCWPVPLVPLPHPFFSSLPHHLPSLPRPIAVLRASVVQFRSETTRSVRNLRNGSVRAANDARQGSISGCSNHLRDRCNPHRGSSIKTSTNVP